MDKRSDLVNPKSLEVCGSHPITDDEYEEYTEEEILSDEEPIEEGSSNEESAEEVPCGEPDDEDSCAEELNEEDSDEELEEAVEEDSEDVSVEEIIEEDVSEESEEESNGKEPLRSPMDQLELEEAVEEDSEDVSVEEIIEEDVSEESEEESNGKEPLRSPMDQLPLVNDSDVPGLLEEKIATDAVVDPPRASGKRRRSGWDIRAEDAMLVNDRGNQGKERKTRWSSDIKAESSMPVNDIADQNKRRKTRWSSDEDRLNMPGIDPDSLRYSVHLRRLNEKLQLLNQKLDGDSVVNLKPEEPNSFDGGIKKKNPKPKHNFMFKKKLYLPLKEYPNYNFVGLILGPKGNTLKQMEKVTGATILLRGKGSVKKKKRSPHDHDDLHVMVEADSQFSFDTAVSMVEKLLVPVDDRQNSHKAAQLRELAEIRRSEVDNTYADKDNPEKKFMPAKLYVGCVPESVSTDKLKELFLPYGSLCEATVIVDKDTGMSKGYGFVRYTTSSDAANAIEKMNGYMIDGKALRVKLAGNSPPLDAIMTNFPGLDFDAPVTMTEKLMVPVDDQQKNDQAAQLFVGCVPLSVSTEKLKELFLPYGRLRKAIVIVDKDTGISKGFGFVKYTRSCDAAKAIEKMNGYMIDGKTLKVKIAGDSPPLNANLPSFPGLASINPSSSNANLPSFPGLSSSSSNAILPSYHGLAMISPSSVNANLPSYLGVAAAPPSSSSANLPNYLERPPIPSSSSANLPSYPGLAATPSSLSANHPSYPEHAATPPPSNSNLPNYPGRASMLLSSSNVNLPSYPRPAGLPQSSVNPNHSSFPRPASLPQYSLMTKLPSYPGHVDISPSSSTAKVPIYSGPSVLPLSSSNANPPSYPTPAAVLPSSTNANLLSFPGFAAISSPSNASLPSFPGFAAIPPSSNANLPSYPGFSAIPRKVPEQNTWPGPPGSLLPEPGTFFKSSINSLAETGRVPLQSSISLGTTFLTSTSLGKNVCIMDGKKLEATATGTPLPSLNPNLPFFPRFTAISKDVSEPNCVTAVPNELASFPGYVKSIDTHPFNQSVPSSSLSSHAANFSRNFSGHQINPTLRNYNHPTSN